MLRVSILIIFVLNFIPAICQNETGKEPVSSADTITQIKPNAKTQRKSARADAKAERKRNTAAKKKKFKENWALPYPNPHRAGIYSLILPSAGQIYNKRYWKLPFVWGGFGALVYSVGYNKREYNRFNEAYGAAVAGEPHEFESFNASTEALRSQRNAFDKNLQLTYVGFVAMYALTALDAYVDAHLKNFDISDDLSFNFTTLQTGIHVPSVQPKLGLVLKL